MPATPRSYSSAPTGNDADDLLMSTEGLTFTLDGVTFTCNGRFDAQDFADLAAPLLEARDGWFDPDALAAVSVFYQTIMGETEYRRFSAHRRRHRTPPSVVAQIVHDLVEEMVARPPARRTPLPDGPPPTGVSSPDGSPSPATPEPVPEPPGIPVTTGPDPQAWTPPGTGPGSKAADPAGILPPEWQDSGDIILAPPPPPGQPQETEPAVHKTINLGDGNRTRVEPLYPESRR